MSPILHGIFLSTYALQQWDILEFIRNPQHVSPRWPEGYWSAEDIQADETAWEQTLASFRADLQALQQIATDPTVDLYAPIPPSTRIDDAHTPILVDMLACTTTIKDDVYLIWRMTMPIDELGDRKCPRIMEKVHKALE